MKVNSKFEGQKKPFEDDRTFHVKTLPVGARISSARVKLAAKQCEEFITFDENGAGSWGATKHIAEGSTSVVVDFHARRMVVQLVTVANPAGTTVQVDLGGLWMPLATDGTIVITDATDQLELDGTTTIHPIPPVLVQRIQLTDTAGAPDLQRLRILSLPSNITLRLGEGLPFWARPGELAAEESSPDFGEVLQAFLAEAKVKNGFYDLPLVVHSDTIACLDLEVEIEFVSELTVLPDGVGETTLSFTHNGLPEAEADLLQIEVPVGARINAEKTTALVTGAFQPSRIVHGPTGAAAEPAAIPVTSVQSHAQPIRLEKTLAATAVDLRLALDPKSPTATISLNILADSDGKPANEPLLPEPATISLDRDTAGTPTWISTDLPSEFQFDEGERYWLVLQAADGSVLWSADDAGKDEDGKEVVGMHFTDNGGLSWRLTSSPDLTGAAAGLFRLRYTPDRFQMPIELQVGTGEAAQRVSLERFEPLGRIDFDLDFEEVATAINQYMDDTAPTQCPSGDHLANGDFQAWTTAGDTIGPTRETFFSSYWAPLSLGPAGRRVYLKNGPRLMAVSLPCPALEYILALVRDTGYFSVSNMAINPAGTRAYVATTDAYLHVIDLEASTLLEGSVLLDTDAISLAVTPDGQRLYWADIVSVHALDTILLEQAITDSAKAIPLADIPLGADLAGLPNPLSLKVVGEESGTEVDLGIIDLDISPDGRRLYVMGLASSISPVFLSSLSAPGSGSMHVFNIGTHTQINNSPIPVGQLPNGISLSPDGRWAVVTGVADAGSVSLVDTARLITVRMIELPTPISTSSTAPNPVAVVSRDSRRAYVATGNNAEILIIDLEGRKFVGTVYPELEIVGDEQHAFINLALTPQGDYLYVDSWFSSHSNEKYGHFFLRLPIGVQLPEEWTLTAGSVSPDLCSVPDHPAAVLGLSQALGRADDRASSLSQTVPVGGGYGYDFSFWGRATDPNAVAEVIWMSDACGILRVDEVPIKELGNQAVSNTTTARVEIPDELKLHRARLEAPSGSVQAEIRFQVPANGLAVIDEVSFNGTLEAVSNGDLRLTEEDQLADWSLSPAGAPGLMLDAQDEVVLIRNNGTNPITMMQTFPVTSGQPYVLIFQGRVTQAAPGQSTSRIELQWLTSDEAPAGSTATLEIPDTGPDLHTISNSVPGGAVEAELHLVVPGMTTLAVQGISFQPVELVGVPITFVSQAPGTLTISDFKVAYEMAAAPQPPIPEAGLCTPTATDKATGDCCYCPCCGDKHPPRDPKPATTTAGRPAVLTECDNCGAEIVRPGGPEINIRDIAEPIVSGPTAVRRRIARPIASITLDSDSTSAELAPVLPMEEEIAAIMPLTPVDWAELASNMAGIDVTIPQLTTITGIGPARAKDLTEMGIDNSMKLVGAKAAEVAEVLPGVSVEMASRFIVEAEEKMSLADFIVAPLVSSIMLTTNGMPFVSQAIEYFMRQDYPNRELIIVNDGSDPIENLLPEDSRIHYIRLDEKTNVGPKNNIANEQAKGEIIVHWSANTWMSDWRLSYQVASLLKGRADICGLNNLLHYDLVTITAWHSKRPPGERPWMPGSTLCYTKKYWRKNPFPDLEMGEDIHFIRSDPSAKILVHQTIAFLVDIIHEEKVNFKKTTSPLRHPFPAAEIRALMGKDWAFYAGLFQDEQLRRVK